MVSLRQVSTRELSSEFIASSSSQNNLSGICSERLSPSRNYSYLDNFLPKVWKNLIEALSPTYGYQHVFVVESAQGPKTTNVSEI